MQPTGHPVREDATVEREVALGPVVEPATVVRHSQELASHVVQFYESDEYLARIVAEFFAEV